MFLILFVRVVYWLRCTHHGLMGAMTLVQQYSGLANWSRNANVFDPGNLLRGRFRSLRFHVRKTFCSPMHVRACMDVRTQCDLACLAASIANRLQRADMLVVGPLMPLIWCTLMSLTTLAK